MMCMSLIFFGLLVFFILVMMVVVGCDVCMVFLFCDSGVGGDGLMFFLMGCMVGGLSFVCEGNMVIGCVVDGSEMGCMNCVDLGEVCVSGIGCVMCWLGLFSCNMNNVECCNDMGIGYELFMMCDVVVG